VFGLGFGEFLVLLLVAMVVLGPRELPRYLRKAGQFAGKMRRLAYEMREKSGIDEVLRSEGLDRDIAEIRKLTRGELAGLSSVLRGVGSFASPPAQGSPHPYVPAPALGVPSWQSGGAAPFVPALIPVDRTHEYPSEGADSYGALPDTATVYEEGALPPSLLAEDPLYTRGVEADEEVLPAPAQPAQEARS
jgi:sec-independent protein translocase protein TatB